MLRNLICALWLLAAGSGLLMPGSASAGSLIRVTPGFEPAQAVETVQYRTYYGPGAVYRPRGRAYGQRYVAPYPRGRAYGRR